MNKIAIELFAEFFSKSIPLETVEFLIEQYELVSEFDSSSIENDVISLFFNRS